MEWAGTERFERTSAVPIPIFILLIVIFEYSPWKLHPKCTTFRIFYTRCSSQLSLPAAQ